MTTRAIHLGKDIDIVLQSAGDYCGGAKTANRICMKNYSAVTFILALDAGNGTTDDVAVDLQEHTLYTGGTSADLDIITKYFYRTETTLDGDEAWTAGSQTAASEIAAIAGTQECQNILVVEVTDDQLSDGYTHISLNTPDFGNTDAKYGVCIALCWLKEGREPTVLPYALTGANP